ncbi:prefoldin subunit alpha [Stygiolobus caldivivus]|uniref:Prefoldin subunit alpha n=1 Tax=Stygiolobus caldivivus TaxID=2824673 RepID=A0A8D5U7L6_9CREN|nr:prefoldin subunit alpha [Stygiolobus caldivivus]BCU70803.1 prefoldin subunit alpha [Stygiolobus caldivivus]
MSGREESGEMAIDLEAIYQQAVELKDYIETLQKTLAEVLDSIESVKSSKNAIDELGKQNQEYLLLGDRKGNIMFRVSNIGNTKVIVHLGMQYFVEVDPQTAKRLLDDKEKELTDYSKALQNELAKSVEAYNQLAQVLSAIQAQAQKGG